jgi:hypothetical protein
MTGYKKQAMHIAEKIGVVGVGATKGPPCKWSEAGGTRKQT